MIEIRRCIILFFSLLLPALLLAGVVTREQAAEVAARFLASRTSMAAARGTGQGVRAACRLTPVGEDSLLHIFNVEGNGGYVIVSGDDRTAPVLGYADSGSLRTDDMPENVSSWLQSYREQLTWMKERPDGGASARRVPVFSPIAPMVTSQWDQLEPYNYLCPSYSGVTCPTGCVATAIAQIMNFHEYPAQSSRIPAYTTDTYKISVSAKQPTNLNWYNMADKYDYTATNAQKTAVATLMMLVGAAIKTDYAPYNAGTYSRLVAPALVDYFGYDGSTRLVTRLFYTTTEWENMIYEELENRRPVYYSGVSIGGGHAFVIDGYEDGYFHVNWGWSGGSDGYFLLDILDPEDYGGTGAGAGGFGYSMEQVAVVGIKPGQGATSEPVRLSVRGIEVPGSTTFTRSSGRAFTDVLVKATVLNMCRKAYTFDVGFGVFNEQGQCLYEYLVGTDSCNPNDGFFARSEDMSFGAGWSDGTYTIKAISRESGENVWMEDEGADKYAVEAVIKGNRMTLSEPKVSLSGSVEVSGELRVGKTISVRANLTNSGKLYSDYLYLYVGKNFSGGKFFELESGSSGSFEINTVLAGSGTQTVKLCSDELGEKVVAQTTISVNDSPEASLSITATCPDIYNNTLKQEKLRCNLSITNNLATTYDDNILVGLFKMMSGNTTAKLVEQKSIETNIGGHRSKTINTEFGHLDVGGQYLVLVYYISKGIQTEGCRTNIFVVDEAAKEQYAVTGITLPDESYYRGIEGTVKVSVRNDGNVDDGVLYLWADRELASTINLYPIRAGEQKTYEVTIVPKLSGQCTLSVSADSEGREVLGSTVMTVKEPEVSLVVTAMEILTQDIKTGMPVELKLRVANEGMATSGTLYVFVNGSRQQEIDIALLPGEEDEYVISYVPEVEGDYIVQVANDEEGRQLQGVYATFSIVTETVEEGVTEAVITQLTEKLKVGVLAMFSVTITNEGDMTTGPFHVFMNDSLVATLDKRIAPKEQVTETFGFTPLRSGHNQLLKVTTDEYGRDIIGYLSLNIADVKNLFTVQDIFFSVPEYDYGDKVTAFIYVENWGDSPDTELYVFFADSLVQTIPVFIPVDYDDSMQYSIEFTPMTYGEQMVKITADKAGKVVLCSAPITIHEPSGIVLPTVDGGMVDIYAVNGKRMGSCRATELHNTITALPEGIYIVRSQQGGSWKISNQRRSQRRSAMARPSASH